MGGLPPGVLRPGNGGTVRGDGPAEHLGAKLYKAIDGLEAVIQHNASDLSTWIPLEYTLNKTYADDKVAFSD